MGPIPALRAGLIALVGLAASACAGAPVFLPADERTQTSYGAVLSASYANRVRDLDRSAELYGEALSFDPGSAHVTERAFLSALTAGDFRLADTAAAEAVAIEGASQLSHRYVDAARLAGARMRRGGEAETGADAFSALIASIIADWEVAKGGRQARQTLATRMADEPMDVSGYRLVHRALILEAGGLFDEAEATYRAADAALNLRDFTAILLGEFLERRGRQDDAALVYQAQLTRSAPRADPELAAALERVEAGARAPRLPNEQAAAARALYAPAAFLVMQAPPEYAALYLRMIQRIEPGFARAGMALAELFEQLELEREALAAYDRLEGSVYGYNAGVSAAWLRFRMGEDEAALSAIARLERGAPYDAELARADMLRFSGRCEDALPIYLNVIDLSEAGDLPADWRHQFYAGICTETVHGFSAAEPYYVRALELAPEEPMVLNHLGYSWIVGGERVDEGVSLTEQAVALAPQNGSILDSYGWGLFKLDRRDEAVRWLERAAAQSPANATIQWHLGDAYAAVGRELEASFQWRRALALDPDPDEEALLQRRLDLGLAAGPEDVS
ncbi:hypothetical protein NHF45_02605 [Maricaulaceae bacterium NA33B04]|nr:hypothetical protein [Maricaulaceae bacterium NA33B04]